MKPKAQFPLFRLNLHPRNCLELNLSAENPDLKYIDSQEKLGKYIQQRIRQEHRLYAIGGYGEKPCNPKSKSPLPGMRNSLQLQTLDFSEPYSRQIP